MMFTLPFEHDPQGQKQDRQGSTVDDNAVSSKGATKAAGAERSSFSKGQKVEARWGGKKRFFPAVITKVNDDGTLHLLYTEDNETESNVDAGTFLFW